MSDPGAVPDPIDQAYRGAEAMLDDEAARAARRAQVLAAVSAQAAVPAPAPRRAPPRWIPYAAAAGLAGFAVLVTLQTYRAPTAPPAAAPAPTAAPPPANPAAEPLAQAPVVAEASTAPAAGAQSALRPIAPRPVPRDAPPPPPQLTMREVPPPPIPVPAPPPPAALAPQAFPAAPPPVTAVVPTVTAPPAAAAGRAGGGRGGGAAGAAAPPPAAGAGSNGQGARATLQLLDGQRLAPSGETPAPAPSPGPAAAGRGGGSNTVSALGVTTTGTNIPGVRAVGSPVTRMNREDVLATGTTNLRDALGTLPQIQSGAAGDFPLISGFARDDGTAEPSVRLRAAAAAGRVPEIETLLAAGAAIDAPDAAGDTALMLAIRARQPAAAALLRQRGASLERRNTAGQSATDMARALNSADMNRALGLGS